MFFFGEISIILVHKTYKTYKHVIIETKDMLYIGCFFVVLFFGFLYLRSIYDYGMRFIMFLYFVQIIII